MTTGFSNVRPGLIALAVLAAIGPWSARADESANSAAGPNALRVGAYLVQYHTDASPVSGPFTPSGLNVDVKNLTTLYFAYLRDITPNWTVELTAGWPPVSHTVGKGPAALGSIPYNGVDLATVRWFSPTVLGEYNFRTPSDAFRPYVGAGVNYTHFFARTATGGGEAVLGGPTTVYLSDSVGLVGTIGATYRIDRRFSLDMSYSRVQVNSHFDSNTLGVSRTSDVHFNPGSVVLAVGYSF
jgi:outer membrane protein